MVRLKPQELKQKPRGELEQLLAEKRERRDELRFLIRQKKAKNVRELPALRKDIARILTILRTKFDE